MGVMHLQLTLAILSRLWSFRGLYNGVSASILPVHMTPPPAMWPRLPLGRMSPQRCVLRHWHIRYFGSS